MGGEMLDDGIKSDSIWGEAAAGEVLQEGLHGFFLFFVSVCVCVCVCVFV